MCLRLRLWDHIMKIKSIYLTNKWQEIYQIGILALYISNCMTIISFELSHFSGSCILTSGTQSLVVFPTLFSASSKSWLGNILGIFHCCNLIVCLAQAGRKHWVRRRAFAIFRITSQLKLIFIWWIPTAEELVNLSLDLLFWRIV